MDELNLDALLIPETRVTYDGKSYTLRAPTDAAATRFQSMRLKGAKVVGDKVEASVERVVESQKYLVASCLFDEQGRPVPLSVIEGWQTQLVAAMFKQAHKALEQERETEEGLERQIAELQSRLEGLRSGRSPEEDAKN